MFTLSLSRAMSMPCLTNLRARCWASRYAEQPNRSPALSASKLYQATPPSVVTGQAQALWGEIEAQSQDDIRNRELQI